MCPAANLPPLSFSGDQLRELHEAFLEHRAASVTALETRAVIAPPMSTVADFKLAPYGFAREPTRVASRIPTQVTNAASVTFYRGSTAAGAAATVAEGAAKPESTPGWTAVNMPCRKIAHWTAVSTEALADFPSFQQVVGDELLVGVVLQENLQVLSGDGTGTNLTGLTAAPGVQVYAPAAAEARLFSVLHAIQMLRTGTSFVEATDIILHPTDLEIIRR